MSEIDRLRDLDSRQSIYVLPTDDVVEDLLIPALGVADGYRCMVGYFDSGALRSLGPGLASYIHRSDAPLRLLASPVISEGDRRALEHALVSGGLPGSIGDGPAADLARVFDSEETLGSALASHTLACLAHLLKTGRLELRLVYVKGGGIFHLKVWLFSQGGDLLVANGSNNMTNRALSTNVEQVRVERSWSQGGESSACRRFSLEFESYWNNDHEHAIAIEATEAARRHLLQRYPVAEAPSERDYFDALEADGVRAGNAGPAIPARHQQSFEIPTYLDYQTGEYSHQGEAVDAWRAAGNCGILELATGAGKTITSLIAARKLNDEHERLMLVIAVPSRPLIDQWIDDVRQFGLEPVVPSQSATRALKLQRVLEACRRARFGPPGATAIIITHEMLVDSDFKSIIRDSRVTRLLIADEMHRLGRPQFLEDPPDSFDCLLGLSATPELQYRPEESDRLQGYFGGVAYRFGLERAIGRCLVPYNYFVHPVELTEDEVEKWLELTQKLRRSGFRGEGELDSATSALLAQRRGILELAENKLPLLHSLLMDRPREIQHTLIYSSDKGPRQHDAVTEMLIDLGIVGHQLTQAETGDRDLVASLLRRFAEGELQVITAKRVLDEGINLPEVTTAYLLSSTTMERQWVQRRGRILRQCKRIGKTSADLHDFLVLPPAGWSDEDLDRMVVKEIGRLMSFAELSKNVSSPDGPLGLLQDLAATYLLRDEEERP